MIILTLGKARTCKKIWTTTNIKELLKAIKTSPHRSSDHLWNQLIELKKTTTKTAQEMKIYLLGHCEYDLDIIQSHWMTLHCQLS